MKSLKQNLFLKNRLHRSIVFSFLVLVVVACKKETPVEVVDLVLPLNSYYISEGDEIMINIVSGNNKYMLSTEQEDLIQANYSPTHTTFGNIRVKGLKKGTAQLTILDEVNGQEISLEIHVVDPYLVMIAGQIISNVAGVSSTISNNIRDEMKESAIFEEGEVLIIQRNAGRQYFRFENQGALEDGVLSKSGNYTLEFSVGGPHKLTLVSAEDNETLELKLFAPEASIFSRLLEFSREDQRNASQMDAPENIQLSMYAMDKDLQSTSPVVVDENVYIYRDWTDHFRETHQDIEVAESFQAMSLRHQQIPIGEGIL